MGRETYDVRFVEAATGRLFQTKRTSMWPNIRATYVIDEFMWLVVNVMVDEQAGVVTVYMDFIKELARISRDKRNRSD